MLGSLNCMHWRWKKCLVTCHGLFIGDVHDPTIILEAICEANSKPQGNKITHFVRVQAVARKNVGHAFGLLQSRFGYRFIQVHKEVEDRVSREQLRDDLVGGVVGTPWPAWVIFASCLFDVSVMFAS